MVPKAGVEPARSYPLVPETQAFTLFSNTYLIFCSANSSKLQPWKTYKCYRVIFFAEQNELFCRCYFFTPSVSNVVFCHCYGSMAKLILCTHQVSVLSFVSRCFRAQISKLKGFRANTRLFPCNRERILKPPKSELLTALINN